MERSAKDWLKSDNCNFVDSLEPKEVATVAEECIKILRKKPHDTATEALKRFIRISHEHVKKYLGPQSSHLDGKIFQIGKITVSSPKTSRASDGIDVFPGLYESREVTIKRYAKKDHKVAYDEIDVLIKVDCHKNIARYHGRESDDKFVYLAMEDYKFNFSDLMTESIANNVVNDSIFWDNMELWRGKDKRPSPILLRLLRDIASGIAFLHKNRWVHRSLNPENILIEKETTTTVRAKLSGMGFSRKLRDDRSSISNRSTGYGLREFKAPEQLDGKPQKREVDMYSLGCVFFYGITQGLHPYGKADKKIIPSNLSELNRFPEAEHLISRLLRDKPEQRPKIAEVLRHPMFWDAGKRLNFLRDASDEASSNHEFRNAIKNTRKKVFGRRWKVNEKIINHGKEFITRDFNFESVSDLLRLIRNMFSHHGQLPSEIQTLVGLQDEEFDDYFTSCFPKLLIEVYKIVCQDYKGRVCFKKYFKGNV